MLKKHFLMWMEAVLFGVLCLRLWITVFPTDVNFGINFMNTCTEQPNADAEQSDADAELSNVSAESGEASERVERPVAALTFDDGPNPVYTPMLLEGLKERGIRATFFLMGENIEGNEELVVQMKEDGHLIGNHTYHHVELDKLSKEDAKKEIITTNEKIYQTTGTYPSYIRPPYGAWPKNLDFYVNMFPVLWSIDTLDWKTENVSSILKIVMSQVTDGSVILMHDGYETSVEGALKIADLLMEKGFDFVTVDELLLP